MLGSGGGLCTSLPKVPSECVAVVELKMAYQTRTVQGLGDREVNRGTNKSRQQLSHIQVGKTRSLKLCYANYGKSLDGEK